MWATVAKGTTGKVPGCGPRHNNEVLHDVLVLEQHCSPSDVT